MTADEFRGIALSLPEVEEGAHQGHADFRVRGRIFATFGPDEEWGMLKLARDLQASLVREAPEAFEPFQGAWGRQGCTKVHLAAAKRGVVREAVVAAWRKGAPKRLLREIDAAG